MPRADRKEGEPGYFAETRQHYERHRPPRNRQPPRRDQRNRHRSDADRARWQYGPRSRQARADTGGRIEACSEGERRGDCKDQRAQPARIGRDLIGVTGDTREEDPARDHAQRRSRGR